MGAPGRRSNAGKGEDRPAGGLTGGGPSQLGVVGAMRVRDVSRPRPEDDAEADRLVQVSYRRRSYPRPPLSAGNGGSSPDAS